MSKTLPLLYQMLGVDADERTSVEKNCIYLLMPGNKQNVEQLLCNGALFSSVVLVLVLCVSDMNDNPQSIFKNQLLKTLLF